jgi:hypothetical protein
VFAEARLVEAARTGFEQREQGRLRLGMGVAERVAEERAVSNDVRASLSPPHHSHRLNVKSRQATIHPTYQSDAPLSPPRTNRTHTSPAHAPRCVLVPMRCPLSPLSTLIRGAQVNWFEANLKRITDERAKSRVRRPPPPGVM